MRFKQVLVLGVFMNLLILAVRGYNRNYRHAFHFYP